MKKLVNAGSICKKKQVFAPLIKGERGICLLFAVSKHCLAIPKIPRSPFIKGANATLLRHSYQLFVLLFIIFLCPYISPAQDSLRQVSRGSESRLISPAPAELPQEIFTKLSTSGAATEYYAGLRRAENVQPNNIARLKIMRITGRTSANGGFQTADVQANTRIVAVVLDSLGNFLPALHTQGKSTFSLRIDCLKNRDTSAKQSGTLLSAALSSEEFAQCTVQERTLFDSPDLSVALCTDKAAYMQRFAGQTEPAYQAFFASFGEKTEKLRIQFDHRIATDSLSATGNTAPNQGLTALYKAAYKAALLLKHSERKHKVLVMVCGGADDASIVYTLRDVLETVQESGITVYALALGSGADSYALRTMAHASGGRLYRIDENAAGSSSGSGSVSVVRELISVLQEIANSYKAFYEITVNTPESAQKLNATCSQADVMLALRTSEGRSVRESAPLLILRDVYYSQHQIVATFPPVSADIDEQFEMQVSTLGETLKDNPTKVIELLGHADQSGSDLSNRTIGLKRAQSVKRYLLLMGVNPAQIRLRSVGREKPVFYFESEDWKARTNRRVELRWLDPALVPYEILAQIVSSEEDAMRLETEWNARGYDAYYEAFLINRIPVYRLKLWGFPTLQSAEKVKNELQQKYNIRLTVQ
jgi:outer membrane protein OmpA-like peptidoglycan-associated protein